jgi:CheY-like chemotaxis protein
MRLLIADSDPTMTELYDSYFSNKGCHVTTVRNGLQCIDAIREQMPDVLVLEHKLPWGGDDGVLECLQQDYPFARPDVVLLTPDTHPESAPNSKLPGVGAYLRKPFLMRDLSKLIQRVTHTQPVVKN